MQNSSYTPLAEYLQALRALNKIYSQQELTEYENALQMYTSHTDPSQFSQLEATQIFPALFTVGKAYIIFADNPDKGFKWFEHAMLFGEKAESKTDFALHYVEMADLFSNEEEHDQSLICINKALEIFNSAPQELDDPKMIMKGHALMTKGFLQKEKKDLDEAAETLAKAATLFEGFGALEAAAKYLIDAYELLANVHYERNDQEKAHLYSIKGLDFIDKAVGLDNPRGESLTSQLVIRLTEQGEYK